MFDPSPRLPRLRCCAGLLLVLGLGACGAATVGDLASAEEGVGGGVDLLPSSDVEVKGVVGVGNASALFRNVDDGVSFSSADDSTTYVRGAVGISSASHTVGYSGAPAGVVTGLSVHFRAQRGSAQGTVQSSVYDGATLLKSGPVHTLSGWANYSDVFTGLSLPDANLVRTSLTFRNTSSSGALRYTQVWVTAVIKPVTPPGADAGVPPEGGTGGILLPLEVLGTDGYTVTATLPVTDPTGINALYLRGNSLGYRNGLSARSGQAKASVSFNGGAFLPLTNATALVALPEKSYGGIGGGFHTVRLTLPISGVHAGANTVSFRFNATDGVTSGYRVLELNLMRGGTPVLPPSAFSTEDPFLWRAPNPSAAAAGGALWRQQGLLQDGTGKTFTAACADCHAVDGRDLKYFNYSNWSIEVRARFHGLTDVQGEAIASYIRSVPITPSVTARPWSPTYQPAAGSDSRSAQEWSAGGGLGAVLDDERQMLPALLPPGSTWAQVAETRGTLNLREIPIAIQLPDWNMWLPAVHPMDVWGADFLQGAANQAYQKLLATLPGLVSTPTSALVQAVGGFDRGARAYVGLGRTDSTGQGPWRTLNGTTVNRVPASIGREHAKLYLAQWMAVKHWELMQTSGAETLPLVVLPPVNGVIRGEARGWPSSGQSVWAIAPHMSADNKETFTGQDPIVGTYLTTAWYQLQLTLNPAMRLATDTTPMDWEYHLDHMTYLYDITRVPQSLRYMQTMIKAYQQRDNGLGPSALGWQMRFLHPWQVYGATNGSTAFFDSLDTYAPGLRSRILSGMLSSLLTLFETRPEFALARWPRRDPTVYDNSTHSYWYALESTSYTPKAWSGSGDVFAQPNYNQADSFYRLLPRLKAEGVDGATLSRLVAWCQSAWPQGNWSTLAAKAANTQ